MFTKEIERKFILARFPGELLPAKLPNTIFQGYLSIEDNYEVRISNRFHLTVKRGHGMIRDEQILEMSKEQFEALWPLTEGKRINKLRHYYYVPLLSHTLLAEVDVYLDKNLGLSTVEVEFENEDQANRFEPPDWFGEDVTMKSSYKNSQLAN